MEDKGVWLVCSFIIIQFYNNTISRITSLDCCEVPQPKEALALLPHGRRRTHARTRRIRTRSVLAKVHSKRMPAQRPSPIHVIKAVLHRVDVTAIRSSAPTWRTANMKVPSNHPNHLISHQFSSFRRCRAKPSNCLTLSIDHLVKGLVNGWVGDM
jgi:hypothetical protein